MYDAHLTPVALESRARRAANRAGLRATKSRWRRHTCDNYGQFQLVDETNTVVGGSRYDMTAEEVIEFCTSGGHP